MLIITCWLIINVGDVLITVYSVIIGTNIVPNVAEGIFWLILNVTFHESMQILLWWAVKYSNTRDVCYVKQATL